MKVESTFVVANAFHGGSIGTRVFVSMVQARSFAQMYGVRSLGFLLKVSLQIDDVPLMTFDVLSTGVWFSEE